MSGEADVVLVDLYLDLPIGGPAKCRATIVATSDSEAKLQWTDFVANEWEFRGELSTVLARLACLARCAEDDFETFFAVPDDVQFTEAAKAFLEDQVG